MRSLLINAFLVLTLLYANVIMAQQTYSINVREVTFEELLQKLKTEYNLSFAYDSELISGSKISLDLQADNMKDLLYAIWEEAYMDCKFITDRHILLRSRVIIKDERFFDFIVEDEETGEPLEMVAVSMSDGRLGTFSDTEGHARLFPEVSSEIEVDFYLLGYEKKSLKIAPADTEQRITLTRSEIAIDEVIVTDRITPITYSFVENKITIRTQNPIGMASSYAGNDILRQVQLLPGVSAHNDASARLRIRGGDENQTLIVMDGIPIYNASHYYGIFSAINSTYVDQMSLFKNNLPIQYGGKTSGMLDMVSKSGLSQTSVSGTADINLLTTSLSLQIPLERSLMLSVSGRTSYNNVSQSGLSALIAPDPTVNQGVQNFSLISRQNIINSIPDFRFNDWNAKLAYKPNDRNAIELNFYHSNDFLSDGYQNFFNARRQNVLVNIEEKYTNNEDWSNLGISLRAMNRIDSALEWHNSVYFTSYDNDALVDLSLISTFRNNQNTILTFNEQLNNISDLGAKSYVDYNLSGATRLTGGAEYIYHDSQLSVRGTNLDNLQLNKDEQEFSPFMAVQHITVDELSVHAGLRSSYYSGTDRFYLAPRINVSKKIDDTWSVKGSAGRHYQFVRELTFENVFGRSRDVWTLSDGKKIPVSRSDNIMVGLNWVSGRFAIDIEAYQRWTEGVIEYAFTVAPFTAEGDPIPQRKFDFYQGTGQSKGIDFMLSYTSPLYTSWMSYTLSESTNAFARIQKGLDFPAQDDRRHQWKWVNEFKWKDFNFNANMIYASGRPYTDISLLMASNSREQLKPEDRISRLPDYIRMDFGVNYKLPFKDFNAVLGLSAFNILDRNNVNYIQYIFSVPANPQNQQKNINTVIGTSTDLLPRTINLNLSVSF